MELPETVALREITLINVFDPALTQTCALPVAFPFDTSSDQPAYFLIKTERYYPNRERQPSTLSVLLSMLSNLSVMSRKIIFRGELKRCSRLAVCCEKFLLDLLRVNGHEHPPSQSCSYHTGDPPGNPGVDLGRSAVSAKAASGANNGPQMASPEVGRRCLASATYPAHHAPFRAGSHRCLSASATAPATG